MKNHYTYLIIFLFSLFAQTTSASVIIPPSDIGKMCLNSELVVYGTVTGHVDGNSYRNSFLIKDIIKGNLQPLQSIVLAEYSSQQGDLTRIVSGDTDFKVGTSYLLFLFQTHSGDYKSRLLSLSAYEEAIVQNELIFAHEESFADLYIADNGADKSGLSGMYKSSLLINHLKKIVRENELWDEEKAGRVVFQVADPGSSNAGQVLTSISNCPNAKPTHCTTLIGNENALDAVCDGESPGRFKPSTLCGTPSFQVCVSSSADDDPTITNPLTKIQTAVTTMNAMPGFSISYQGVADCSVSAPCDDAVDSVGVCESFPSTKIWIFLDDPCGQIEDLGGGGSVLAIGGSFFSSSCAADCCGNMWKINGNPFVILNNNLGSSSANFTSIVIHEMLHGIGLGHISGSGTAVMNGVIDNSYGPPDYGVSALDESCTEWMYNISPSVPIELLAFSAVLDNEAVALSWKTASEANNEYFIIEKSIDSKNWVSVGQIDGAGNSNNQLDYRMIDNSPYNGLSYYRLKQIDYDGTFSYSEVESVNKEWQDMFSVYPNPATSNKINLQINENSNGPMSINLYNTIGQLVHTRQVTLSNQRNLSIDLEGMNSGLYLMEARQNTKRQIKRIFIKK